MTICGADTTSSMETRCLHLVIALCDVSCLGRGNVYRTRKESIRDSEA